MEEIQIVMGIDLNDMINSKQDNDEAPNMPFFIMGTSNRYDILSQLFKHQKLTPTQIATNLSVPLSNFSRDLGDLYKTWDWLSKDKDGNYQLKPWARTMCDIFLPTANFITKNLDYFNEHDFGNLPKQFTNSIGVFANSIHIKSVLRTESKEKLIFDNSNNHMYNILSEARYSSELMEILKEKLSGGLLVQTIFSQNIVLPENNESEYPDPLNENRKSLRKYLTSGQMKRKMMNDPSIAVVMNESEALVMFPRIGQDIPDISEGFYSNDKYFYQWCLDYFNYCWNNRARSFEQFGKN